MIAIALTTVVTVTTGCANRGPGGIIGDSPVELVNELKTRPSYEDAAASYIKMLDKIRAELTKLAPNLQWLTEQTIEDNYGFCAPPYADVPDAQSGIFVSGGARGGIPDSVWPQVKQSVVAIAAQDGFINVVTIKDKPGDHMLIIRDKWKASLELGSLEGTSLDLYGPCLLRSEPAPSVTTP